MRKTKQIFYIRDIVEAVAGNLYGMAPRNRPRDIDKIMFYLLEKTEEVCVDPVKHRHLSMTYSEFGDWLEATLKGCPEFCNLNLTQHEYDKGVSVYDESRPKITFTSIGEVATDDSWKDDFIDLVAAIQNISNQILAKQEESDCFLCSHSGDEEVCSQCRLKYRHYENRYECENKPFNTAAFAGWCNTGCPAGLAICCKDCNLKDECTLEDKCTEIDANCPRYTSNPDYVPGDNND